MHEGAAPWGRLAVLAAGVLALHAWWLQGAAGVVRAPVAGAVWNTRTVAAAPAPSRSPAVSPPAPAASPDAARQADATTSPAPAPAPAPAVRPAAPARSAGPTPAERPPSDGSSPPSPAIPVAAPPSARLHYAVTAQTRGTSVQGQAQLDWQHDGQQYRAQWQFSAPPLRPRAQESSGLITHEGLVPQRFSERARQEEAAHFDRDGGRIVFSNNRPEAALVPGAQDRLSVMLQLAAMVAAAPARFVPGTSIEIQTASTRELQPWRFTIESAETLELPGGMVDALKLLRVPTREFDLRSELWLAPAHGFAPVRLRLTQPNGDWVDHQWSSTEGR